MRRSLAAALILLTFYALAYAQEHSPRTSRTQPAQPTNTPDDWTTFNSPIGHFSILMPVVPKETIKTTDSEHGPYTSYTYIAKGQSVYAVGWVDYDPAFNFNRLAELEANRDNLIKGLQATLLNTKTVIVDGYQAIDFTAETADQTLKSRVYMVGRRPYQLVAITSKGSDDSINVARFFASFKVKPQ